MGGGTAEPQGFGTAAHVQFDASYADGPLADLPPIDQAGSVQDYKAVAGQQGLPFLQRAADQVLLRVLADDKAVVSLIAPKT
jgi:hypothetical protein